MQIEDNTIQEVSGITAFLSLNTCGEACWHAKEDICRCYCNGRNHGCLKSPNGISPMRMAKIDGYMYTLRAFGKYRDLYAEAKKINDSGKPSGQVSASGKNYPFTETQYGAWARLKPPTYNQTQKWAELSQFKGLDQRGIFQANGCDSLYGLWERTD